MNKSESKYFNTALLMDKALIALLEKKDFEYITIKEICAKAGVNRSTFYLHYETIADLLKETMEYYNDEFLSRFHVGPDKFIRDIEKSPLENLVLINSDYLTPYLEFIKEHKSIYRAAVKNPVCMETDKKFENISNFVLAPIMTRFNIPENEQKYRIKFYIKGCVAIIEEWISRNCVDSIEDIERIMAECVKPQNYNSENEK